MAEYLERESILNAIRKTSDLYVDQQGLYLSCELIAAMPAADVKPVIHAKWVLFGKDCCGRAFYCSNCRKATTTDDFETTPLEREEYFCPRCGADMRNE